ncbi:MAG: hypothetical protein L0226_14480 [Acidobacteria bacterium]|nr:hypothetical protein [Acidobacteriota bacterium]
MTEHLLGRRIEDGDALSVIHRDDGVHRRIDDAGQAVFALAQRLFGFLARGQVVVQFVVGFG